jgi:biotin operon repressor
VEKENQGMSNFLRFFIVLPLMVLLWLFAPNSPPASDLGEAAKILGFSGQMEEGAFVVRFGRSDIKVSIDGEPVPTAFGFGSWTAWKDMGKDAIVMGDLVLLEKEVNPVISALQEAGIQVTALHNHFFYEQPRVMFIHIGGMGDPARLAQSIRNALDKTATPRPTSGSPAASEPALNLDTKRIEEIIGHSGKASGGSFKITVGRPGVKMHGVELTASMGLNSWAGFVGTDEKAHVAGDVVMSENEVNRVIQALRKGGIEIVAVHNHMLDEQPRVFFLHYWGTGPAARLAQTVRAAFDEAKGPIK